MRPNLVQIGTGSWVNPEDVLRVYTCDNTSHNRLMVRLAVDRGDFVPVLPDTTTYVACKALDDNPGTMFGIPLPNTHIIVSDWTPQQVEKALGLISPEEVERIIMGGEGGIG